ncbi:MAG: deoxyribose-phosphate aldolase [Bacteroidota bacterium]|jgi:deoxyribose-phosphate aldolase|nr:deoxyribose-phosphate aldolase [Bacteroidales bacterium]MDI9534865.1 deoxyribose-phosphate aldolase [Bacteroidota bacterium]OQC46059.1 MAG: Deoxyribose-phosphate aldolase [Bacteroidetes bacterium ADurb.Bin028]NLP19622.1 deoxyribose-phosphate aldolase [Bacteroidales bacterium]HNY43390.1 deoxyribose-phosphate aldolase [Bacteroidales bacterium]
MENPYIKETPSEKLVNTKVAEVKSKVQDYKRKNILIDILNLIDLTSLNGTDTIGKIKSMTEKVNNFSKEFPKYKNVAAICVYPALVPVVKENLTDKSVKIAAVGAGFPASQTFLSVKAAECDLTVQKGADEIDIVLSLGSFLEKDLEKTAYEVKIIKSAIKEAHLKVILETGELKTIENIFLASLLSMEAGADFIKTSTGKTSISATPEAVYTMCSAIKTYYLKTGRKVGIKPSGGMTVAEDALLYYLIVNEVLGEEWLNNKLFRIGASRLANNLLKDILSFDKKTDFEGYF